MKQKIEWYREVLELEPGSKIFFPLARMLAEDGQVVEAISVLRQGVARHADHTEARFLLVELLFQEGDREGLWAEVDAVSAVLGGYPGFWQAWGERLGASPATRDAGLAVIFLAAYMRHDSLSWADIIASGLKGLLDEGPDSVHSTIAPVVTSKREGGKAACVPRIVQNGSEKNEAPPTVEDAATARPVITFSPSNAVSTTVGEKKKEGAPVELAVVSSETQTPEDDESEEPFSLRTRSMAEVLAEQGDIAGALEIYQELLDAASIDTEKKALSSRMAELKLRLEPGGVPVQEKATEDAKGAPAKNRLSDMLEALAQRLEARSLQ